LPVNQLKHGYMICVFLFYREQRVTNTAWRLTYLTTLETQHFGMHGNL